jgi:hypothetical protein
MVAAQKTFLEIYKQFRGEYMGSLLSAQLEGLWPYMKHEPGDLDFRDAMGKTNISSIVKDLENSYPPEWRISRGGRKKK